MKQPEIFVFLTITELLFQLILTVYLCDLPIRAILFCEVLFFYGLCS